VEILPGVGVGEGTAGGGEVGEEDAQESKGKNTATPTVARVAGKRRRGLMPVMV
jgi:hypothetical protein